MPFEEELEVPQLQNVPHLNSMNIASTDSQTQLPQWMRPSPVHITSYLNTLHVRQITEIGTAAVQLNATIRVQPGAILFINLLRLHVSESNFLIN